MKMNILKNGFQALIIMSLMVACSLGDVLEPSDGVSMALMETVDTSSDWKTNTEIFLPTGILQKS